jgi:hypothetical protein
MVLANRHLKAVNEQDKDDQRKPDSAIPYVSAHNVYYVK